jgi:tape measure domain-containing protein
MSDFVTEWQFQVKGNATEELGKTASIMQTLTEPFNRLHSALDKIISQLTVLARNSSDCFAQLVESNLHAQDSTDKLRGILGRLGTSEQKANTETKELEKELDKLGNKGKDAGDKVTTGLIDNLATFGQAFVGIKAAAQTIAGAIGPIFEEGMARETAVSDFTTLFMGDKDKAVKYAEELRTSVAATLYGAGTINESAKNMLAYGVDADTAQETLNAIGDIAMGDANKMNSLATAFSQMSSLGKLQTQDWKQMVGAGFNPFIQMAKDLGKTNEELDTMMSKGEITADMVKDAFVNSHSATYTDLEGIVHVTTDPSEIKKVKEQFEEAGRGAEFKVDQGQFFGALDNTLNHTFSGKMAKFNSSIDDLKAKLFELALPIADKIIPAITDGLIPAVSKLMNFISPVFDILTENIDTLGVFAGIILTVVGVVKLWTGVQTILNAVMSANPVSILIVAIAALIAMVYKAIEAWDTWGAALTLVLGPIGHLVNLIMTLKSHWDSIVEAFNNGGIIGGIKRIGIVLLDCILKPVQQLLEMISKIPFMEDIAKGLASKVENLRRSLDLITPEEDEARKKAAEGGNDTQTTLEDFVTGGAGNKSGLGKATKAKNESIASGGTRNTQITINLGNMVETVNFNGSVEENAQTTVDLFTEQLLRALYSVQTAV